MENCNTCKYKNKYRGVSYSCPDYIYCDYHGWWNNCNEKCSIYDEKDEKS